MYILLKICHYDFKTCYFILIIYGVYNNLTFLINNLILLKLACINIIENLDKNKNNIS